MRWFPTVRFSGIGGKILLLAVLGGLGMTGIAGMNRLLAQRVELERSVGQHADSVTRYLLSMMLLEQELINTSEKGVLGGYPELVQNVKTACQSILEKSHDPRIQAQMVEIDTLLKEHASLFQEVSGNLEKTNTAKKDINEGIRNLHATMEGIVKDIDRQETQLTMTGDELPSSLSNIRGEIKSYLSFWYVKELNIQDLLLFGRLDEFKSRESDLAAKLELNGNNIDTLLLAAKDAKLTERWQNAMKSVPGIEQLGTALVQHWQANRDLIMKLKGNAGGVQQAAQRISEMANAEIRRSNAMAQTFGIGAVVSGLALLGILCFFIHRSVTKSVEGTIEALTRSSDQVKGASAQIALASQSLAEGASEQAASLEETSSSLEEMASMTGQNASNAGQADSLMKEANRVVVSATSSMTELTHSMMEISCASEETSKIIRTIDEIAFQTNLLALNAAVEAARAGEAGAGFAVVADEVRNLAMRAANAAKSTAGLIEGTVKKVKNGSELVSRTNTAFSEVAKSVAKAGELVGEISAASSEQAQGIGQLNKAVAEMDRVVQQNAANAEESASASEEMSAQAEQMRGFVKSLVLLVSGGGKGNGIRQSPSVEKVHALAVASTPGSRRRTQSRGNAPQKGSELTGLKKGIKEVKPERAIPLDDENFSDF